MTPCASARVTTSGSKNISFDSSTIVYPGQYISGTGIPASTVVAKLDPDGRTIYQFDGDESSLMAYLWRGRLNLVPSPYAPTYVRVQAGDFDNLIARAYEDGLMQFDRIIASNREFRSKRTMLAEVSYVQELIGTSRVRGMISAEDITELGG